MNKIRNKNGQFAVKYNFTDRQIEYIKKIAVNRGWREISDMFYSKYKIRLKQGTISYLKNKYNFYSGYHTKNPSKYVKGHLRNFKGIGYESVDNQNGYTYVTIGINKKISKQRYIWEQHYGKIPEGYVVTFLNQDNTDFRLENLELVKKETMLTCIGNRMISKEPEVTRLGLLNADLLNRTRELING